MEETPRDKSSGTKDDMILELKGASSDVVSLRDLLLVPSTAPEQQHHSLSQRVKMMAAGSKVVLEKLESLSDVELERFKRNLLQCEPIIDHRSSKMLTMTTNRQDITLVAVQTFGLQFVEKTNRLTRSIRLSYMLANIGDSSEQPGIWENVKITLKDAVWTYTKRLLSGTTEEPTEEKRLSALHKVVTMTAVKELLLETLNDLNQEEQLSFKWFLQFSFYRRSLPAIPWRRLLTANKPKQLVDVMVETCGQRCLEVTLEVLNNMSRKDLVQRVTGTSTGPERGASALTLPCSGPTSGPARLPVVPTAGGIQTLADDWTELTQKVETMASITEILMETLAGFSDVQRFKDGLMSQIGFHKSFPDTALLYLDLVEIRDIVIMLVQTYGEESMEIIKATLQKMVETELLQKLQKKMVSDSSSGPKKEHHSALVQMVATIAAVKQLLLENLDDLTNQEVEKFKQFLHVVISQEDLIDISLALSFTTDRAKIVDQMVQNYGQRSVEFTRKVFMDLKRPDLVQRLPTPTPGHQEKHHPALLHTAATMAADRKILLETLSGLSFLELEKFKWLLQFVYFHKNLPWRQVDFIDKAEKIVELMVTNQQPVEVAREVLMDMNRTDLAQRLPGTSSRYKEKHRPSLTQRVETMASLTGQLLETLRDLSDLDLDRFKHVMSPLTFDITFLKTDIQRAVSFMDMVFFLVQTHGQQSVEKTKEVLKEIGRTDLAQRLAGSGSGPKKETSEDKRLSVLIHKVATMTAVKELLFETLNDLSSEEKMTLKWFLQSTFFNRSLPYIPRAQLRPEDVNNLVDLMVEICGQQCVEMATEVLMDMNRMDLMQRLSETSSRPKERRSVAELWPPLIQEVETMASVIEHLLETLNDLSPWQLYTFKTVLSGFLVQSVLPSSQWMEATPTNVQEIVFVMVHTDGQKSLEIIKEVLQKIERSDLVTKLSDSKSRSISKKKDSSDRSVLVQKVATIAAVKQLLLENLNDLSDEEVEKFKEFLQLIVSQEELIDISSLLRKTTDRAKIVDQMVLYYGQRSLELTRKVFITLKRSDLVHRLPTASPGDQEEQSVDLWSLWKHKFKKSQKSKRAAAMDADKKNILEALGCLSDRELKMFRCLLRFTYFEKNLQWRQLDLLYKITDRPDRRRIVDFIVESCHQRSVEVTTEVFIDMNRTDLVQRLTGTSSGLKGRLSSLEPEGCGSVTQESSDWTTLEPEVTRTGLFKDPTYSLQSDAGSFECRVSGLRWVCQDRVSFTYQFCSWVEPMERLESMDYMPAGPLIDITDITGKLDEVQLPHWICIDDNPEIVKTLAVLHISDCGDVVEQVSEVTSSHVRLPKPVFSPRAVLMKAGFPVKVNCNVLIYKTNTAFLTLHVYLIPRDPGLQQVMDKRELQKGYKPIEKPHPEKSLKLRDRFVLTADLDGAEIYPEDLKLRYDGGIPNFFEVFKEDPDENLALNLAHIKDDKALWTCVIRKVEYQRTAHTQGEHFVDRHRNNLVQRVSNIGPILDNLLGRGVIQQEDYDTMMAIQTTQEKMRKLYSGPLKAGGHVAKDIFYEILEQKEVYLVADLKAME